MAYFVQVDNSNQITDMTQADDSWVADNWIKISCEVAPYIGEYCIDGIHVDVDNNAIDGTTRRAQKQFELRVRRKEIFESIIDPVVCNPLRWDALTTEQQQEWLDYRQAWLDITGQADLCNVTEPAYPSTYDNPENWTF